MARKLKVHYSSQGENYTHVPTIMLKGKWLEKAGFKIGDYVEVECEGDRITLTKTEPPEWKASLNEELNRLSTRQKEELLRMIRGGKR